MTFFKGEYINRDTKKKKKNAERLSFWGQFDRKNMP